MTVLVRLSLVRSWPPSSVSACAMLAERDGEDGARESLSADRFPDVIAVELRAAG